MTESQFRRTTSGREFVQIEEPLVAQIGEHEHAAAVRGPRDDVVDPIAQVDSRRASVPSAFIAQSAHRSSPPSSAPYAIFVPSGARLDAPTRSASYERRCGTPRATGTLQSCIVPVRSLT